MTSSGLLVTQPFSKARHRFSIAEELPFGGTRAICLEYFAKKLKPDIADERIGRREDI
jgi:hypothetical protein